MALRAWTFVGRIAYPAAGVLIGIGVAWGSDGVSANLTGKAVAGGLLAVAGAIVFLAMRISDTALWFLRGHESSRSGDIAPPSMRDEDRRPGG